MSNVELQASAGLLALIEANAPFWSAEAEVIRGYWDAPIRNAETDRKWLTHQVYKEYWDGVLPPLALFNEYLPKAGAQAGRKKLLEIAEVMYEEVEHFSMFADLFLVLDGKDYQLSTEELKEAGAWPENDALMTLRQQHISEARELGQRAFRFTEGGYCALFSEGMKLAGRNDFDSAVAGVCKKIYEDEFNHMLLGIIEADSNQLSDSDWAALQQYTVAQMKKRIIMRNAQFSFPVSDSRMGELLAGKAAPVIFDFDYAAQLLNKQEAL